MVETEEFRALLVMNVMNERLRTMQTYAAWLIAIGLTIALANLAALALVVRELSRGPGFD
jgi:hypothetical protein